MKTRDREFCNARDPRMLDSKKNLANWLNQLNYHLMPSILLQLIVIQAVCLFLLVLKTDARFNNFFLFLYSGITKAKERHERREKQKKEAERFGSPFYFLCSLHVQPV